MIRMTPASVEAMLRQFDVDRAKYPLLEFIPCSRVNVTLKPGLVIEVPDHSARELAPAVLAAVEAVVGCSLTVEDAPD